MHRPDRFLLSVLAAEQVGTWLADEGERVRFSDLVTE